MIPDAELVARFTQGEKGAFDILYKRYFSNIYSFVRYKFTLKEENIKDIAQEIMIKAYNNLVSLKDNNKFKSWLFSIALNHGINYEKRKKECFPIDEARLMSTVSEPSDELLKKENLKALLECLEKLQDKYRETLYLFYYEEMKLKEIAEIKVCSIETIQKRKAKGLFLLKQCLEKNKHSHS